MAFGKRERSASFFASICACLAAYALLQAEAFAASKVDEVLPLLRAQGVAIGVLFGVLPWFGAAFVKRRGTWFEATISCGFGALAVWSVISPAGYWFAEVQALDTIVLPWGERISIPRGTLSLTFYASTMLQYPMYLRLLADTPALVRQGRRVDAGLWATGTMLLITAMVHDHGVDLRFWSSPYCAEWVFLVMAVMMATRLTMNIRGSQGELQRLGAESARSVSLYRGIYAAASDAILVADHDRIIEHNTRAAEMFRAPNGSLVGRSIIDLSPPRQVTGPSESEARRRIQSVLEGDSDVFEWRHRRLDGKLFDSEVALVKVDLPTGGRIVAVVRDISDKKRMQLQLEQAQKMESLGRLASGISHDFNNLLQLILGNIESLEARSHHADDRRALKVSLDACHRAGELIQRLLDFSRSEPVRRELTDLNEVIADAVRLAGSSLKGVEVRVDAAEEELGVLGHRGLLQNVVLNLLLNARDAMQDGGTIHVSTEVVCLAEDLLTYGVRESLLPGDYVVASVRDNGTGMKPEVLARCFEPFFSTKGTGGTGLGLATVYGTILAHDGGLTVESTPGTGTEFRIWLPLVRLRAQVERDSSVL